MNFFFFIILIFACAYLFMDTLVKFARALAKTLLYMVALFIYSFIFCLLAAKPDQNIFEILRIDLLNPILDILLAM